MNNKARNTQDNEPRRKAPGTRVGTMLDWRGGSNGSRKISGRHGHTMRDGR